MNSVKNPLDIYSFLEHVAQCRPVLLLFKGAVEYFQLCDGKDEGFVSGKCNNVRVHCNFQGVIITPLVELI